MPSHQQHRIQGPAKPWRLIRGRIDLGAALEEFEQIAEELDDFAAAGD